ncbi:prolyl-tRNA synthetase associated domain-containing protein [Alistipes sp. ZOR0009]|uniref:prolyl-tRNA synthetase associated domain-containing protein n=1 Tax=Alistipes sp. ZOR0009 TaxID=1339253 RepID=UPI000648422F|nr:prolyl-tRNA synthetase associated domain-containing protein [Alistipes sp. ZOR0009]
MNGSPELYKILELLNIGFEYHEHPEAPTIEIAMQYWDGLDSTHCKNLFFRNHKGNKHYLVLLECSQALDIHDLEKRLKQGKISFASPERMAKYLGVKPGSVTPFGLINDKDRHVHVFIDQNLQNAERLSFHPLVNTASLIIKKDDLVRFLEHQGNSYEFIEMY